MKTNWILGIAACAAAAFAFGGCGASNDGGSSASGSGGDASLKGSISIDGSSTVFPISKAVAQEFMGKNPGVKITVSESGTGGGFKKFIAGEIQITGASRPIDEKELSQLKEKGIEFVEIPIAYDGLTVAVNPKNTWATTLTVDELNKIWAPGSTIMNWKDVRAGFPDKPMKFFSPGSDSGTFDYFTEAITKKKKEQRTDAQTSEDDNTLVNGVAGEEGAIAYFGYAYFEKNKDKLTAVSVDNGAGPVAPSPETIQNNTYTPLSRPLFIYVSKKALDEEPAIKALLDYFFAEGKALVGEVGYIGFNDEEYGLIKSHVDAKEIGTKFANGNNVGLSMKQIMEKEASK